MVNWCRIYFIVDDKNKNKSYCKFCKQSYGGGNIARMINHLKECKKIPPNERQTIDNKISKDVDSVMLVQTLN